MILFDKYGRFRGLTNQHKPNMTELPKGQMTTEATNRTDHNRLFKELFHTFEKLLLLAPEVLDDLNYEVFSSVTLEQFLLQVSKKVPRN